MIRLVLFALIVTLTIYQIYNLGVIRTRIKTRQAIIASIETLLENHDQFSDDFHLGVLTMVRAIDICLDGTDPLEHYRGTEDEFSIRK